MLVIVLLLTGILAAFPVAAAADESATVTVTVAEDTKTEDEKKAIIEQYQKRANFASNEEMFLYDQGKGHLDSIVASDYSLYVNRYTGIVYYINNVTGQILCSNPTDPSTNTNMDREVLSQVILTYATHAAPKTDVKDNSLRCMLNDSFIKVRKEGNSIVVDYELGESEVVDLVPDSIFSSDMEQYIIQPLFEKLAELLSASLGEFPEDGIRNTYAGKKITSFNPYLTNKDQLMLSGDFHGDMINGVVGSLRKYAQTELGQKNADYIKISEFIDNITVIFKEYVLYNPDVLKGAGKEETVALWYETVPNMEEKGESVFLLDTKDKDKLQVSYRLIGKAIKANLPTFTPDLAESINEATGFVPGIDQFPNFHCSVVYSIDPADGSLIVDFPTSALEYNQDEFIIKSISYLPYFGSGDMSNDGYIFFPDGSGTVIEFDDFYSKTNPYSVQVGGELYGKDYCYATITGKHKEQVTMPVYGVVNDVKASAKTQGITGSETVTNGFFAILEDGATLATLRATSGGGLHKYATAYSTYIPYSFDEYNLQDAVSVGGNQSYLVVSKSKYTGDYSTRYVMLTDPQVAAKVPAADLKVNYPTTYVGMAACYRDYLKESGVLEKIAEVKGNLPIYIEALGSMNVTQKILTFPVSVSSPLTTFADVKTMYDELSDKGLTNINFKLTGFANGGMYYTYPARVWWENSLGGDNGFRDLVSYAETVNTDKDSNLGIFPDFDFQYINNTAIFDGVSNNWHASKMVDNRYASKQVYDSVSGLYETLYAILVSADVLDELYNGFIKDYSKYNVKTLSVSTLGSDLNSNFDDDKSINRDLAREKVVALLDRMNNGKDGQPGYSLMTDIGNSYTYEFVDHIVNATIDSSHLVFSSYAVPFLGMVLHSYINYAGTPLNYTGSVDYNILHSIENGAALYYILCMQNTNYLKEDEQLSKYYGVDYKNWFEEIVKSYQVLNGAIGGLQKYEIVDHEALVGERVPNSSEYEDDLKDLLAEYVNEADKKLAAMVAAKLNDMQDDSYIGVGLHVIVDTASLTSDAIARFSRSAEETLTENQLSAYGFTALLDKLVSKYAENYPEKQGAETVTLTAADISYNSVYKYSTDSLANAEDYVVTDYTCDNGNIIMVTYKDQATGDEVRFLINYNNYNVEIKVDNTIDPNLQDGQVKTYPVGKLSFQRISIN